MERFHSFVVTYEDTVPLIPLWHGTSPGIDEKIASNGYAALGLTDSGFFGKGCFYSTPQ